METSLRVHNYVYTIQTVPLVGRVDLAAVFLDVVKLKNERLFFSECLYVVYLVYLGSVFTGRQVLHARGVDYRLKSYFYTHFPN